MIVSPSTVSFQEDHNIKRVFPTHLKPAGKQTVSPYFLLILKSRIN